MTYRPISSKSVQRCDLCAWRRDQRRQSKKPYSTVENGVFDQATHVMRSKFRMSGGLPVVVICFNFHQHRRSDYRAMRGRNLADFGSSHYLGQSMAYTTAVLPYGSDALGISQYLTFFLHDQRCTGKWWFRLKGLSASSTYRTVVFNKLLIVASTCAGV